MLHHSQEFADPVSRRRLRHHYVVMFSASDSGEAKRLEFYSPDAVQALQYALLDRARRSADVWEDGEFVCRVEREPSSEE